MDARHDRQKLLRRLIAASAMLMAATAGSRAEPLKVIELFTSQGCSSCPPANANLVKLRDRPGLLALSFGVTYWDYLGWKDSFAKPEFTARQRVYEPQLRRSGPFTPQMVVNGAADTIGNRLDDIEALLADSGDAKGPILVLDDGRISIGAARSAASAADIWLIRYRPGVVEVPVARGENRGHTLTHANVVTELTHIGKWSGQPEELAFSRADPGLRTAVLVQVPQGGPILSAVTD